MTNSQAMISMFVEDTSGDRFECEVPADTPLSKLAADFFESRGWPTRDAQGSRQRAVVELVDSENPDRTRRLRGEQSAAEAGLVDGATLRVFPESIAGAVDMRERISALVADYNDMVELAKWNKVISFETNRDHAPTLYNITFHCPSFKALPEEGEPPVILREHRVEIDLTEEYPRKAPLVRWLTPICHPNIREADGAVCLGVLQARYLPGLGLARLITMLAEMAQYRNYDVEHPFNVRASAWAAAPENQHYIEEIGGYLYQGPVREHSAQNSREADGQDAPSLLSFARVEREGRQ